MSPPGWKYSKLPRSCFRFVGPKRNRLSKGRRRPLDARPMCRPAATKLAGSSPTNSVRQAGATTSAASPKALPSEPMVLSTRSFSGSA
ncbi:hypothetical protein FQZ97_416550 [compost metagenome]